MLRPAQPRNPYLQSIRHTARDSMYKLQLSTFNSQLNHFDQVFIIISFIKMSDFKGTGSKAKELPPPSILDPPPSFEESISANPPIFKTQFACMSFHMYDLIRLINFTEVEVEAVKDVIKTRWEPGLGQTRPYGESTEICVSGKPWRYNYGGNDDSRRLLLGILERLFDLGWVVHCAVDVTRKSESKGKFSVFRLDEDEVDVTRFSHLSQARSCSSAL